MSNGTSEKSRANPKIVTLCNVPGKREWLVNEMEKIGRVYLFFKYYVFKFSNILKGRNVLWMSELCCSEKQPFSFILENNCLRGLLGMRSYYCFLISRFPFSRSIKKQLPEVLYATWACSFIKKETLAQVVFAC